MSARPTRKSAPHHSNTNASVPRKSSASGGTANWSKCAAWCVVLTLAVALTWVFWGPLWQGGGLIGGDLYPYYFPQKTLLSQSLQAGTIPLWNPFVGFGYPILGESQTGALYPPNLLLYSLLNVNTAYNASQLLHYLLAFTGMFALSRRLGLGVAGSLLASLALVYGWFPARICLEWAIIGGAWFVWILWAVVAFLQSNQKKSLILIALFLGLDLLAGHYNLAFITLLAILPLPWLVDVKSKSLPEHREGEVPAEPQVRKFIPLNLTQHPRRLGNLGLAIIVGFLLAGVHLLPTWELKSLSQRQTENEVFAPTYGHLPVSAISQLWMPWKWYAGEETMNQQLKECQLLRVPIGTDQVEAQFYLGLIPFALLILGLAVPRLRKDLRLPHPLGWLVLAGVSLLLATGWPTYWFSSLPGLGFFRGPGRYSLVAACALSLLAGAGLDAFLRWREWGRFSSGVVVGLVLVVTTGDLWAASRQYQFGAPPYFGRQVFYATLIDHPPINFLNESPLRKFFVEAGDDSRLYAPGANVPSLLSVSAIPVYLGLGPEIYESDDLQVDFSQNKPEQISEATERLRNFGVTHLLLEHPLDAKQWPVKSLGSWLDPFLNRALGRSEPYFLYELNDSTGRVFIDGDSPGNSVRSLDVSPNRVRVEVDCSSDCRLVLRDLFYPGWTLKNPGIKQTRFEDHFRAVDLHAEDSIDGKQTIEWVYRPTSVMWGAVLSLLGVTGLFFLGRWRNKNPD